MRGLKTRVAYAHAVVLAVIDDGQGRKAVNDSDFDAELEGYVDYCTGNFEVPAMFRDVPQLVRAWGFGQATAEGLANANWKYGAEETAGSEQ